MFASAVVRWIAFGWAAGLASLVISAHPKFSLYIQKECVGFQLGECNDVVFDFRKAKRFIEFKFHRYHSCLNFNQLPSSIRFRQGATANEGILFYVKCSGSRMNVSELSIQSCRLILIRTPDSGGSAHKRTTQHNLFHSSFIILHRETQCKLRILPFHSVSERRAGFYDAAEQKWNLIPIDDGKHNLWRIFISSGKNLWF